MRLYLRVRPLKLRRHPGGDGSLERSDRTVVNRYRLHVYSTRLSSPSWTPFHDWPHVFHRARRLDRQGRPDPSVMAAKGGRPIAP